MITRTAGQLVKAVYTGLEERTPGMRAYTDQQREYTAEDLAHIVDFLSVALYVSDASLFTGFLDWTSGILTARGVPARLLTPVLDLLAEELREFPRATAILRTVTGDIGGDTGGDVGTDTGGRPGGEAQSPTHVRPTGRPEPEPLS